MTGGVDCPGNCKNEQEHQEHCVPAMLKMSSLGERNTGCRLTLIDTEKIEAKDAEIARLRGLLKRIEFRSGKHGAGYGTGCAFCSAFVTDGSTPTHDADCPAFTPDGQVKCSL